VTGLLFGMAPAWTAARVSIHDTLKGSSQSHSAAHGSTRLRQILLTTELSVSLVLLIGAGLLSRSFLKIARTELGFPTDHLLTLRMNLTNSRYASAESQSAFYDGVLERIQQLPAARGAAISTDLPLSQFNGAVGFQAEGSSIPLALRPRAGLTWVSPQYFNALGVQLKSGRTFDSQDTSKTGPKLVVNAVLAHTVFGGEDPLGRRLVAGPRNDLIGTVVGVVADIRQRALGAEPIPLIYECTCQGINRFMNRMSLIVRTAGDPHAVIPDVESQIYSVDREQPVFDVRTMEERVERSLAPQRFQLILIGAFAAIALILAVAGVYGVMSYLVARRTREIGIRMALGARPQQVQSLVVRESLMLVVIAVVAGLGGAWALTRYVRSMLYGVTALDEVTFAITPLILALIVLSAAFGPARRASRIDPMSALREE
jgi:predicted permease